MRTFGRPTTFAPRPLPTSTTCPPSAPQAAPRRWRRAAAETCAPGGGYAQPGDAQPPRRAHRKRDQRRHLVDAPGRIIERSTATRRRTAEATRRCSTCASPLPRAHAWTAQERSASRPSCARARADEAPRALLLDVEQARHRPSSTRGERRTITIAFVK
jgi:hypothetical protein